MGRTNVVWIEKKWKSHIE